MQSKTKSFAIFRKLILTLALCLLCTAAVNANAGLPEVSAEAVVRSEGRFTTGTGSFSWITYWDNFRVTTFVSGNGGFREDYDFDCIHVDEWSPFISPSYELYHESFSNTLVFEEGITNFPNHLLRGWVNHELIWWRNLSYVYLPKSMTSIEADDLALIRNYVTIYCYPDTEAHRFCEAGGFKYSLIIEDSSVIQKPEVTAPTAVENLEYDGTAKTLINSGSTSAGIMLYALEKYSYGYSTISYSTELPQATEPGNYTVYYKVIGDYRVEETEPQTIKVSIKMAKPKLTGYENTSGGIKLTWKPVKGATGYYIYRDGSYLNQTYAGDKTSLTDYYVSSAPDGEKHTYEVVAHQEGCYNSTPSKSLTAYRLNAPAGFTLTAGSKKVTLRITNAKKGYKYIIYRSTKPDSGFKKVSSTSSSYTNKKLKKGTTYYYRLVACKSYGGKKVYSDYSEAKAVRVK